MKIYRSVSLLVAALLIAAAAHATPGGEGGNTGCNGQGNPNSPCAGTPATPPILIPGPQGPQGVPGTPGTPGKDGINGTNGTNGTNGRDGATGATGASIAGRDGVDGKDGKDAPAPVVRDGKDGEKGEKGESANEFATAAQLNALRNETASIGRNSYAGTAGAIAIGSIPQAPEPGTKIIGAGAGYFRNEGALAVGMSWRSDSGKVISKASASVDTRGALGLGVGVAYVWK